MAKQPKQQEEEKQPVTTAGLSQQEPEQEQEVVVAQQDNAADELKQQLDALRRSEQSARQQAVQATQERDQALQRAQQREYELSRSLKETSDSRLEAIQSGMATAEAEIEEAKKAFRMAAMEQDIEAQISAQERLAEAKANLVNLNNGKAAFEQQIKEAASQAQYQQQLRQQQAQQGDALDRTSLPDTAKRWLRSHPDYLTDNRKNAKIQALHWDVVDEGHQPFSDAYYESLEQHLGLRAKARQDSAVEVEEHEEEEVERRPIVSAPVSRQAPSNSGTPRRAGDVRLTASQKEAAKMAGITEVEYAKQLVKMSQEKANGNYGGQP